MKVIRNTFVDIHYREDERNKAECLAKKYEAEGYSRESDGEECIQLLITEAGKKGDVIDNTTRS